MTVFFSVLLLVSSVILIVSVVLRDSDAQDLGAISGNSQESLWGKNRGTSKQAMLNRVITISAVVFIISAVALAA